MKPARRWLLGGAGALAVAAGAGFSLWRSRTREVQAQAVFGARFRGLDGRELVMARFRGQPLLLNFWATWCPPCVRELPTLDAFAKTQAAAGWQVVGLAVDAEGAVREFLRSTPVQFPIGLSGFEGLALTRELGNDSGGLPFTACFDSDGVLRVTHLGEAGVADLNRWAAEIR